MKVKLFAATALAFAALVLLFLPSWWIADRLFVERRDGGVQRGHVVLVWSDHAEARLVDFATPPRPGPNDPFTFVVAAGREAWVERQLNAQPTSADASWRLRVRRAGHDRQVLQLDWFGDGIQGLVYEATPTEVRPIRARLTGPLFPLLVLELDLFAVFALACVVAAIVFARQARRERALDRDVIAKA